MAIAGELSTLILTEPEGTTCDTSDRIFTEISVISEYFSFE
jgi:hypothetical protein